jgi:hypothetical protein
MAGILWTVLALASLPSVFAQENGWPRTLPLDEGMITIYTPQVDEMNDDVIQYRAALAFRATASSEPVFGAGWFESRVEIDSSNRIVHPTDLKVTETRFPAGTNDVQAALAAALAQQSPGWNLDFSLDELEYALKTAEAESRSVASLSTTPPQIIYRDHPALLISLDGEPVLRKIENSPYQAVINTPYPLIFDGKRYFLNAASNVWYRANKATGPYQFENNPPADIAAMVDAARTDEADGQPLEPVTAGNAPEIVVSTQPAELIVTEGPAAFVPLVDDLLVLQNSDDDVFMHVSSQKFYIVLAGRWYYASSLNGPWAYQPADDLPVAFANIPNDSDQADSRVYVAGTEEAREAVLDAYVPQTAAVARGKVDIDVKYDGEPVYAPVDGTGLVYIENTGSTVIQADGLYYLVEDGVWYVSASPDGPWQVSDHRPEQVDTILPSSPVYNVKYVRVYDSTPEVVYVGYTPGYTGSYVYHNSLFYGTGWYYRPWVSPHYYYPRYSTWGFNAHYNPWTGWGFGLSWGWGPFSFGYYSGGYWHNNHYWHNRHYGYWGPRGYRGRPAHHGRHGYANNRLRRGDNRHSGYGRGDDRRGGNNGYAANSRERNGNLYRDREQRARVAETRDNPARAPRGGQRDNARQSNYIAASNSRQRNNAARSKQDRNRIDPVSPSELRSKASVRDANLDARRTRLLADNSGNLYRRADRDMARNRANSRRSMPAKSSRQRTTPAPVKGKERLTDNRRQSGNGRNAKRELQSTTMASLRTSQSRSQTTRSRSGQQSSATTKANSRRSRTEPVSGRSVQSSTAMSKSNSQRSRTGSTASRSRPSAPVTIKTYSQRTRPQSGHSSAAQSQPRVASTHARQQSSPRSAPRPQSSSGNGRSNSAPAQRAPQRSASKSSSRKGGSNRSHGGQKGNQRSRG